MPNNLQTTRLATTALGDGLILSEFGGRILALMPDGETNLFWVNPEIHQNLKQWESREAWSNIGGDRVWISPEIDTNLPDPLDFAGTYSVPPSIDPGNFTLKLEAGTARLTNRIAIRWLRSGRAMELETERIVSPLACPPLPLEPDIAFAGYALDSRLRCPGELGDARPGVWNLIQTPRGGTIGARAKADGAIAPVSTIGEAVWEHRDGCFVSPAETTKNFKWSLRAAGCGGTLFHRRDLGDGRTSLLVRQFPVGQDADYADCPSLNPSETGHMCQVYVDDGALGGFAEMEFHAPALRAGALESAATRSLTYGFIGRAGQIDDILRILLS
jgi:hypothetical protein